MHNNHSKNRFSATIQKEFNYMIVNWFARIWEHFLFQFQGPITRTRVSFHKITLSGYLLSGRTSSKYKIEWSKNPGKKSFNTYVSKIIVNIINLHSCASTISWYFLNDMYCDSIKDYLFFILFYSLWNHLKE